MSCSTCFFSLPPTPPPTPVPLNLHPNPLGSVSSLLCFSQSLKVHLYLQSSSKFFQSSSHRLRPSAKISPLRTAKFSPSLLPLSHLSSDSFFPVFHRLSYFSHTFAVVVFTTITSFNALKKEKKKKEKKKKKKKKKSISNLTAQCEQDTIIS